MKLQEQIVARRTRRRHHVRNRVRSSGRLRLSVFRSNRQISAQLINDETGHTVASASTLEKALGGVGKVAGNKEAAIQIGTTIAQRALALGIKQVAFDRGNYAYHGRVAALADAARAAGLEF